MTRSLQQARRGFTLVEVIVVISILAIIVTIGAGAYFLILNGQKQDASKTTTAKIDGLLLRKVKMIRDKIKDDVKDRRPKTGIPELRDAGYTAEAAEAIMLYARLKNELPMTFLEAKTATAFTLASLNGGPPVNIYLAPRSEFTSLPATPITTLTDIHRQSAVCLHRALTPLGLEGLEQQIGESVAGGEKCFKDSGGKPIIFTRLAFNGDQAELNTKNYDPYFPKKLPSGSYQNLITEIGAGNATLFWNAVTPLSATYTLTTTPTVAAPNAIRAYWGIPFAYPGAVNHTVCVISWGQRNEDSIDPLEDPATPGVLTYNPMTQQPWNRLYNDGNIVSYRLREEGAKGD